MDGNIFDELDKTLEEDGGQKTPKDGGIATAPKEPGKPDGKTEDGKSEDKKNLQELVRQQSEDLKSMKDIIAKQQTFIDKVTGADEEAKKRYEEAKKRESWDDDPQRQVQAIVAESEKRIMAEIHKNRSKLTFQDVAAKIHEKYDVNLDDPKVAAKIVPVINLFSKDSREKDPAMVLESALKLTGEAKEREALPFIEGGGSGGTPQSRAAVEKEADAIRTRIFGDDKNKKQGNVFGI